MLQKAGFAAEEPKGFAATELMEVLENRVLLAGDHPSFNDVFNTTNPQTVQFVDVSGGTGSAPGLIATAGENDVVMRFVAPADDFVRVWADALTVGSTLDSRVEIWQRDANSPTNAPTTQTPLFSGSNNGILTSGPFLDGWVGFIAEAGQEYFVLVRSDTLSGQGATGPYVVRVNSLSSNGPALDPNSGVGNISGNITLRGSDIVYRVTTGPQDVFSGILTAALVADPEDLDPRLDIYDAEGNLLIGDSDTGSFSDSFGVINIEPNMTFYVRVRSDKLGEPGVEPSTGAFQLRLDGIPNTIAMNPVTRLGRTGSSLGDVTQHRFFKFEAQGTGLTIISLEPTPLPPIQDSAIRLYNEAGILAGFNEQPGAASRMFIQLQGGQTYYLVVENFNGTAGGVFRLSVESHHTFTPAQGIDDHQNTPTGGVPEFNTPEWYALHRQFQNATPVIWGDPQLAEPPPFQGLPAIDFDHSMVRIGQAMGRIHAGGDTDLFQFVPPTDMLGTYEGEANPNLPGPIPPPLWAFKYRPATRLQILTQTLGTGDGPTFINTRVRVFDSNFELVYDTNDVVVTGGVDPAGMLDPASFPPELPVPWYGYTFAGDQPAGIEVWGGEVYYLEVSGGGSIGRYDVVLQVDAEEDGVISEFDPVIPGEGQWEEVYELRVDVNTGEASNFVDAQGGSIVEVPPGSGNFTLTTPFGFPHLTGRWYAMDYTAENLDPGDPNGPGSGSGGGPGLFGNPGTRGRTILQSSDLGVITTPTDKDLYMFRALYTGYAEVWVNTTQLLDTFLEGMAETEDGDPMTPPEADITRSETKVYNSPLDSALRVFDNDFQEIAYNNDSGVVAGETDTRLVGDHGERTFFRRDARVVIPVESGKNYFIQVESGQLHNFRGTVFPKTDWRHATGSYELLVNSMANRNFVDDHINADEPGSIAQATPINADLSVNNTVDAIGIADGRIDNDPLFNPLDSDTFFYVSPGSGTLTFTASTRDPFGGTNPDSFTRRISIFTAAGNLLGNASANGTDDASVDVVASQGSQFFIVVDGDDSDQNEGHYRVTATGAPFQDDFSSLPDWFGVHVIDKDSYDYDKVETISGRINNPGDTDIFSFDTIAHDVVTVSVEGIDPSLRPTVTVYEVSEDPAGNPVLLRIAQGGAGDTVFSVTKPQRTSTATGRTYNQYFVIVGGVDPDTDFGDYEMTLNFGVATDDHPDEGQWELATVIDIDALGHGSYVLPDEEFSGTIELAGDSDMFQFVSPAQGPVTITVNPAPGSTMRPAVRIYDGDNNPVLNEPGGETTMTAPDEVGIGTTFSFTATRNTTYFIVIEGVPGGPNTTELGTFDVSVVTPIPDDHANISEFEDATPIPLSSFSGNGAATGELETPTDSDLFTFTTITPGNVVVTITVPGNVFNAFVHLFEADGTPIGTPVNDGGPGDEDGITNGRVVRTMTALPDDTQFFVMVTSNQSPAFPNRTGPYTVFLAGPRPPQTEDDHTNAGDWANATFIPLSLLTGDAELDARIDNTQDSDLFFFTSLSGTLARPHPAFIQVVTAAGDLLDVSITVFTGTPQQPVAFDAVGAPGANASVTFNITQTNAKYWVLVTGLNQTPGNYTLRIDTAPASFYLFYPEGFASNNINEYVTIGNPDTQHAVTYSVRLRFEDTSLGEVTIVDNAVVPANSRRGVTISEGTNYRHPAVPAFKPYAIIIESNGFLAANISHYDFGSTLGEAFTSQPSTMWSFAKGTKFPGQVNDFLVYYNPNPTPVRVTLTAYQPDGTSVAMAQIVQGNRRLGWNFNNTAALPTGNFAFTVTSEPVTPTDEHVGIIAALSHYDLVNETGYGILGDSEGGTTAGIVPQLLRAGNSQAEVTFFNNSNTVATVGIIGRYIGTNLPNITQTLILNPFSSATLTGADLGMTENNVVGLRYDSTAPVTVLGGNRQFGATDATQASGHAAKSWFWGDAFMNAGLAGSLYFEDMYFYNPNVEPLEITLRFHFNTSDLTEHTFTVGAKDFARIPLHALDAIIGRGININRYSVEASASMPFVAKLSHYDLVLNGGWGSKGAPLGLTNPVSTI